MTTIAQRLKYYRKQKQLTQNQVAAFLGYKSFTTIQKWEDGTSQPSLQIFEKLCELYEVSFDVLVNGTQKTPPIPVLGQIRAGQPIYAQSEQRVQGEYFYLKVVGDSMKDARILEGDEILVKATRDLDNGKIGVVLINDEATVKRVYRQKGQLILKPENPDYQPMVFTQQDILDQSIIILGEVIENKIKIK